MVEYLMTISPVTIGPDDPVQHAAQLMDDFNVGALPVWDGTRLVGMVTDRDITVRATAVGLNPQTTPVHLVMSSPVRSCCTDENIAEVLQLMAKVQIRRVPVLDRNERLVGIVSLGDLAERVIEGAVDALRSISTPARPDRIQTPPPANSREAWVALPSYKAGLFP